MTWLKGHWQLFALLALALFMWDWPVMLPLKLMVVFFHELSHGAAAILTGGEILRLSVSPNEGGLAVTQGGSRFLILSAGYLGSLLCGVALLLAALWSRADKAVVAGLGVGMLVITALYLRGWFPLAFGLAMGCGFLAVARFLPHQANDLVLRVMGLTSLIYAPRDIISDTIRRSHLRSDAFMLGEEFFGGAVFWGVLWLVLSVVVIALCLRLCLARPSNIELK